MIESEILQIKAIAKSIEKNSMKRMTYYSYPLILVAKTEKTKSTISIIRIQNVRLKIKQSEWKCKGAQAHINAMGFLVGINKTRVNATQQTCRP